MTNPPGATPSLWKQFWRNRRYYVRFSASIFLPGHAPDPLNTDQNAVGQMTGSAWSDDARKLVVDEGRRQCDRLYGSIDQIRSRAQVAFTTGLALSVVTSAQLAAVSRAGSVRLYAFYAASSALTLVGVIGALALLIVRVKTEVIHAAVLSRVDRDVLNELAHAYADVAIFNERGVSTLGLSRQS